MERLNVEVRERESDARIENSEHFYFSWVSNLLQLLSLTYGVKRKLHPLRNVGLLLRE
jgi:hypothetical protein